MYESHWLRLQFAWARARKYSKEARKKVGAATALYLRGRSGSVWPLGASKLSKLLKTWLSQSHIKVMGGLAGNGVRSITLLGHRVHKPVWPRSRPQTRC